MKALSRWVGRMLCALGLHDDGGNVVNLGTRWVQVRCRRCGKESWR